ncbi:MAG TPA: ZIP family metal transporter [Bacteroidia bacterium]|jgi:zinc transporter ZupT|nr:ZIP family metal transporter [Bacteroidia bacterium]
MNEALLLYGSIAFASVMASGALVLFMKIPRNAMRLLLAFSGAFLFAISLLHLVPELYASKVANIGMWILAGFLIQLLLEYLSEGIEHGHVHADDGHTHDHAHAKFPMAIMLGLSIHSFLEGMPLGTQSSETNIFPPFLTGIVLHNIPIAIAFMGLMLHLGHPKSRAFFFLAIFSVMTPLGMIVSHFIGTQLQGEMTPYFTIITAVVVGIFLHISTTILFESTENHRFNFIKFVTILAGVAVAWLVVR